MILYLFYADDTNCVYIQPKNAMSTLQDEVEHTPSRMAKNKLSLHIGKTELVHFLSCRDENVKMANTIISPTKSVKYLGVHLDKNLTFKAHVRSVIGKLAKHVSVIMRLRNFCISSIVIRYYNIYMKPIIQYGLLVHGCTKKSELKDILLLQKKVLRILFQKLNKFHVPQLGLEFQRQSLKYRGTLLLNYLLRKKLLPPDYEICESRGLCKSLRNIQNRIKSECLADIVFVRCPV